MEDQMNINNQPLVSVILPTYNGERFLTETLQSVLDQTYKNLEIIIIDDCSTDNTVDIIKSFKDERIKFYQNEHNLGIAENTNIALKLATGKYIMMQDHDDISAPYRVMFQVNFLEDNKEVTGCAGGWKVIKGDKHQVSFGDDKKYLVAQTVAETNLKQPFRLGDIFHPTIMYRRSILDKIDKWYSPDFKIAADLDFKERLATAGATWAVLGNVVLAYRLHSGNTTKKKPQAHIEDKAVRYRIIKRLMKDATNEECELHAIAGTGKELLSGRSEDVLKLYKHLLGMNTNERYFDDDSWRLEVAHFYKQSAVMSNITSFSKAYKMYTSIDELKPFLISKMDFLKFYLDRLLLVAKWKIRGSKWLGRRI